MGCWISRAQAETQRLQGLGFEVLGDDTQREAIARFQNGRSPIAGISLEPGGELAFGKWERNLL